MKLPELPYEPHALEPHISVETMSYHYKKHHRGYVEKLNELTRGTPYADLQLEEVIDLARKNSDTDILNNALQAWNHTFLWNSFSPDGGKAPGGRLARMIENDFGDIDGFKKAFREAAGELFGSGWVWLVEDAGKLRILKTRNADSPVGTAMTPLLVLDVWEHAYYIDYRHDRANYVSAFLDKLINWDLAESNGNLDEITRVA